MDDAYNIFKLLVFKTNKVNYSILKYNFIIYKNFNNSTN